MTLPRSAYIPRDCGCIRLVGRVLDVLGAQTRLSCGVTLSKSPFDGMPKASFYTSVERRSAFAGNSFSLIGAPRLSFNAR